MWLDLEVSRFENWHPIFFVSHHTDAPTYTSECNPTRQHHLSGRWGWSGRWGSLSPGVMLLSASSGSNMGGKDWQHVISGNCTLRASSRQTKFFHYPLPPFKRPRLRNITDYAPSLLDSQVRVRSDLNLQVSHFHLVKPVSSLSDPLCWTPLL
jgi:hypothetical protein